MEAPQPQQAAEGFAKALPLRRRGCPIILKAWVTAGHEQRSSASAGIQKVRGLVTLRKPLI
jgi:hypothetical protein